MSLRRRLASNGTELAEIGVALAVAATLAVLAERVPPLVGLVGMTALVATLLYGGLRIVGTAGDAETARWLRRATGAMFAVHLLLALAISSSRALVQTFGGDAVTYHLGAVDIVRHWHDGTPVGSAFVQTGKEGFFYALAAVYWVFGPLRATGLAVIAGFAAAVVPVVHDTTRRLFGSEAAKVAAVMVMVLPGFAIWTSQLLREAPIVFFLALAANAAVRLGDRLSAGPCAVLASALAVLFTLRANVALVAASGVLVGLALGRRRLLQGATTGLAALAVTLVLVLAVGVGYRGYALTSNASLKEVSDTRIALARSANTGIAPDTDISTTRKAARFLPVALVDFAFGPFLWQVRNGRQLGGALEAITLWLLLPSLWRGWRAAKGVIGRRRASLVAPAALVAVALSLLIGNYGTVVRERLQVTVFLIPLAAYGWTLRPAKGRAPVTAPDRALSQSS